MTRERNGIWQLPPVDSYSDLTVQIGFFTMPAVRTACCFVVVLGGDVELSLPSYQLDCNLQRKMIPLRSVMACGQDVDKLHDDFQSRQPLSSSSSSSGLVLVTSLIDRTPNLGVCRRSWSNLLRE
jgi:hypothetical protein